MTLTDEQYQGIVSIADNVASNSGLLAIEIAERLQKKNPNLTADAAVQSATMLMAIDQLLHFRTSIDRLVAQRGPRVVVPRS